jgi:hypothetical protein
MQRIVSSGQLQQWFATTNAATMKKDADGFDNKEFPAWRAIGETRLEE